MPRSRGMDIRRIVIHMDAILKKIWKRFVIVPHYLQAHLFQRKISIDIQYEHEMPIYISNIISV